MHAGRCPKCNTNLDFVFGNPEVEAAYGCGFNFWLKSIKEIFEAHEGRTDTDRVALTRKMLMEDAESCPGCGELVSGVNAGPTASDILGRPVRAGEVGLVVSQ